MPSRWRVHVEVSQVEGVRFEHLHALVQGWFPVGQRPPPGSGSARGNPFSITPLRPCEDGRYQLHLGLLDDALEPVLAAALERFAHAKNPHLGTSSVRLVPSATTGELAEVSDRTTWAELAAKARPRREFRLRFRTPTVFIVNQRYCQPLPGAGVVFGSYARRWRDFAPDLAPRVDVADATVVASSLCGETSEVEVKWHGHLRTYVGFVGEVRYRAHTADRDAARALDALALVAEYAGTGAITAAGMGVTSYERSPGPAGTRP